MAADKLVGLHPTVVEKARRLIALCKAEGIELVVTSGYRSFEEQAKLYAQGRTKPGKRVTNAAPGQSWHNHRCAIDVCPVVSGKLDWESKHWDRIGALGESLGFTWGGRFKSFPDRPHLEYHPGITLAEANRLHAGQALAIA